MGNQNNQEIELKFGVLGEPTDLPSILRSIGTVSNERTDELSNIYFDTDDQKLFGIGAGLRIRNGADFTEQTLKLRGENLGGMHSRGEFNVSLPEGSTVPDLGLFPAGSLPPELNLPAVQSQLKPITEITFTRHSFDFAAMDCLFEVAYDHGGIRLEGDALLPINELEVELKQTSQSPDEVMRIFCALITTFADHNLPLVMEPFSKMHRATVALYNRRTALTVKPQGDFDSLPDYIMNLMRGFEQLYGLFLLKHDPLIFSYINATLRTLIRALTALRKSGTAAFTQGQREPVNYAHDLKIITRVMKAFLKKCERFEKVMANCALKNDQNSVAVLIDGLRRLENRYQIYVIPLKLNVLLSMLVR